MNTTLFNKIDFIAVPVVLGFLFLILKLIRKKQPIELQSFFLKGFFLRVLGTLTISIVYQFIYGYGDTFAYYQIAQNISSFFSSM